MGKGTLAARVRAGDCGPVITLAGETDLTSADQLELLITAQLSDGIRQLTIDVSDLQTADVASVRKLMLAARVMTARGGNLVVLNPQPSVARVLALLDVDEAVTIRHQHRSLLQLATSARRRRALGRRGTQ